MQRDLLRSRDVRWAALTVLTVLTALFSVLTPAVAQAHQFGLSLVEYEIGDTDVTGQVNADLEHLNMAAGVDTNRNRIVTEQELLESRDAVYGYLISRMKVTGNGEPCEPKLQDLVYDGARTAGVIWIQWECGVPLGEVVLTNKAFREQPGNHQWVAVIAEEGRRHRVVFNKERTEATYQATPPEAPEVVEQTDQSVAEASLWSTVKDYLWLGVEHIVIGLDHVLFVLTLIFVARRFRQLVAYITAFTVAHSITLALAVLDVVSPPGSIVEPLIAATILFVAIENILREQGRLSGKEGSEKEEGSGKEGSHKEEPSRSTSSADAGQQDVRGPIGLRPEPRGRALLVFGFGLIHGFGFAGVLAGLGLPEGQLVPALVSFNLGVELGQLAIVAVAWPVLHHFMARRGYPRFVQVASGIVGLLAAWWLVERTLLS